MIETITFPVGRCETCDRQVLAAQDLDESGELVPICPHCDTLLTSIETTMGGLALRSLGYDVEGEGPKTLGCGTGGSCTGCSK